MDDSDRLKVLKDLSFNEVRDLNRAVQYSEELIALSNAASNNKYLRAGYFIRGTKKRLQGKLDEALNDFFKSAEVAKKSDQVAGEGDAYSAIGDIYSVGNNHNIAVHYYNKGIDILRQSNDSIGLASSLSNAGDEFLNVKKYDSALQYFNEAKLIFDKRNDLTGKAYSLGNIGMVYANIGKNDLAEKYITQAIYILEQGKNYDPICAYQLSMADVYLSKGDNNAAINYAHKSLQLARQYGLLEQIADADGKLSELYEKEGDHKQALQYYKDHITYRDSLNNLSSIKKMYELSKNYEISQKQAEVNLLSQQKRNQKTLVISLAIILAMSIIILGILLKNNKNKQQAYSILDKQKKETEEQKAKAEEALNELQLTQMQLIQSEKMASLGELTAGIAHEIQNPLNFVNNFSEVSVELLGELKEGPLNKLAGADKATANDIINDLSENLTKINHHGRRADSIVKGMLQHSRISANKKELTDINALADEYLRLSYHGLRAKDSSFNASFETIFDPAIQKILIVPQDIGRVLLNIYNNAFYTVNQKSKMGIAGYQPKVLVATKAIVKEGGLKAVQIEISDNGMGIPTKILNKIYQPFFTTKPAGQGTGLGLSLSYDIITNEHKGQLTVDTKEGEYAKFVIELPDKSV